MKPIFIIGLPGAGKTTLAKELATKLNLEWVDTDIHIEEIYFAEKQIKKPITEIYQSESALFFRMMERKVLHAIPLQKSIISCGGGLPCFFDNIEYLNKNGHLIWLNTPITQIAVRLDKLKIIKPSIASNTENTTKNNLLELLEARKSFYNKAKFILQAEEVLNKVEELLR